MPNVDVAARPAEAQSVVAKADAEPEELSLTEALDKFLKVSPRTLNRIVSAACFVLTLIGATMLHVDWDTDRRLLHMGFLVFPVGLWASVQFVLAEEGRLERERKALGSDVAAKKDD